MNDRKDRMNDFCFACTIALIAIAFGCAPSAWADPTTNLYRQTRATADGIGKSYMGREIAQVMGFQGAQWLEREEREQEERDDDVDPDGDAA